MADMEERFAEYLHEEDQQAALYRALRALEKEKNRSDQLADAVYQAAHDAIATLKIPPVPKPKPDTRKKAGEVAICELGDWHLGKRTPDFNSAVCEERVNKYADKVELLTNVQRSDHPVRECHIHLLGDTLEGELVFPGQAHRIDASLYRQLLVDGPRILGGFVRRMSALFDIVKVMGVFGNHTIGGRERRDMHPESNLDAMLYQVTRLITEDERVDWVETYTEGERSWYAIDEVLGHRFFIFHGNQIKGGFAGFPWYGASKKLYGWDLLLHLIQEEELCRYAVFGHFHTPVRMYLNGITAWGNGTMESYNTYAMEELASAGEPCQWLLFAHPDGVSAEYLVRL